MGKKRNAYYIAGHEFTLKNIRYGIHSEETIDFIADLYCDGTLLANVSNEGHGGCTFYYITAEDRQWGEAIASVVSKEIWLTCRTGDVIYHNLGTIADELLEIISVNAEISIHQPEALVFEYARDDKYDPYIKKQALGIPVKDYVRDYPGTLAKKIAELEDAGYRILNTNIPKRIFKAAEEWRSPSLQQTVTK